MKLTPAGKSLYEDARILIRFSEDALQKARLLAESSESTLRIGTSLLYKCRMLPDLWPRVNEIQPDLKIEIRPMKEYENRTTVFSRLGLDFDLFEGIYASAWKGSCRFLELQRTPLCCAVSRSHQFFIDVLIRQRPPLVVDDHIQGAFIDRMKNFSWVPVVRESRTWGCEAVKL